MAIDYSHALNTHTREGGQAGFAFIAAHVPSPITSLIDVGCGTGPWLRAALDNGVQDVVGVDGVLAPAQQLEVDPSLIRRCDLTAPLDITRRFDIALCLEVAEHLDKQHGPQLIESLTRLADTIIFSAACPNQPGQHHVNCQWPEYWQTLFNAKGFTCDDQIRWAMWTATNVEPWYRQNMFIARRSPDEAGSETRIRPVLHPEMALHNVMLKEHRNEQLRWIEAGFMPAFWYLKTPITAVVAKAKRHLRFGT